jgi:S-methylmethionine-dependent homocysteine/selenocysteine methylase
VLSLDEIMAADSPPQPPSLREGGADRVVLLDGAMGSLLASRGVCVTGPAWSARALLEAPEAVASVHREYVSAGATVHTANSFRATDTALAEWKKVGGPTIDTATLLRQAFEIARASVPATQRIAASLAPLRDCYEPEVDPVAARLRHRKQLKSLSVEAPDLILCETFANGAEVVVAVEEANHLGLPVWAALTMGPRGDLQSLAGLREAASRARDAGAEAVLLNCSPAVSALETFEAVRSAGVSGIYANAGTDADRLGHLVDWGEPEPRSAEVEVRAERYADLALAWIVAGAEIVGGCCGTTPAHIAAIRARLSKTVT